MSSKNCENNTENSPLILVSNQNLRKGNVKIALTILGAFGIVSVLAVGIIVSTNPTELDNDSLQLGEEAPANSTDEAVNLEVDETIQVTVDEGVLQGIKLKSRDGRDYLAFKGIPYAKPPIGELRFKPPVATDPWEGTLDATQFRNSCIEKQRIGSKKLAEQPDITEGSEDCLYLNVFTPKNISNIGRRRNRLPVMFYIHGGAGGAFGSGRKYGADYFMDEEVVLVTLDYRIGVMGNLNTNTTLASGNQGLKDQTMALQWVQNNIAKFGGDRRKVTIFGNSFGGIQVTAHMNSPMSEGLYHRAIAQSGTFLYPGFFTEDPIYDAVKLGELLNCPENTTNEDLTACLNSTDVSTLVLQSLKLKHQYNYVFTISVDSASEEGDVFIPQGPLQSLQENRISTLPFMTGIVDAEGLKDALEIMINNETLAMFNTNWSEIIVPSLYLEYTVEDPDVMYNITKSIKEYYFNDNQIDDSQIRNLTNMFTDRLYLHPAITVANALRDTANNTNQNGRSNGFFNFFRRRALPSTYLYYFNHEVETSRADPAQLVYDGKEEYFGECHADELQFIFPFEAFPFIGTDHKYYNFSKMVVKLWTTFADTGVPTGATNNATWQEATQDKPYQFFELNDAPRMMEELTDRINFWNQFDLSYLYM